MKHTSTILVFLVLAGPACVSFDIGEAEDPRLGDFGRVRFVGGGCNSSTTLATGSTVDMTLEPQTEALPNDLSVASTEPGVIEAVSGESLGQVVLRARDVGESFVELRSMGALFDGLVFNTEPAEEVLYEGPVVAFSGGTLLLNISGVYGACGEDCPLIGWGFLDWTATDGAFAVVEEREGLSAFRVIAEPSDVVLVGREPTRGALLVEHPLSVLATARAGDLEVEVQMVLPDETLVDPQLLPVDVPRGSLFQLLFYATTTDGHDRVLLPATDHQLTLEAGGDTVELADGESSLEGPVYVAREAGEVRWAIEVPLLGWSRTAALSIVD